MNGLVFVEIDNAFALRMIGPEVQAELEDTEKDAAGQERNEAGMNE